MVRCIQRVPLNVRWNAGKLEVVASSRYDLHVSPAVQRRLVPDSDIGDLAAGRQKVLKGMPLRKGDFVKFGYTEHCPRCEDSQLLEWGKTSKTHSRICRERLEAELQKTPDGRRRMDLHAKQEAGWIPEGVAPAEGGIDDVVRDIPPANLENPEPPDGEFAALRGSIRLGPHPSERARAAEASAAAEDVEEIPEVVHDSDADDEAPPLEVGPNGDVDMGAVLVDPQPGRSGTGSGADGVMTSSVTFSTSDKEPAGRVPTQEERYGVRTGKSRGPSGLNEAGQRHCTSNTTMKTHVRQNVEDDLDPILNLVGCDGRVKQQLMRDDDGIMKLVRGLGGCRRAYRKERARSMKAIYSF